jgi:hypothetical protein
VCCDYLVWGTIRELVCFSEIYETDVELAKHETNAEQIEKLRI